MKIKFKQWLHPQMGVVPVDPKTPLVLEAEIEREWVGLTNEERRYLRKQNQQHDAFALAIEAMLKEKNT